MKYLKRLSDRINRYLFDSSIYVKDRTFVLFSACIIAALALAMLVGIILHEPISSTLVSLGVTITSTILLMYAVKRNGIKRAKIIVAFFAVFIFMPFMFFTKGGIYAGGVYTLECRGSFALNWEDILCGIMIILCQAFWCF